MAARSLRVCVTACAALLSAGIVAAAPPAAPASPTPHEARFAELEAKLHAATQDIAVLKQKVALAQQRIRKLQAQLLELTAENIRLRRGAEGPAHPVAVPDARRPAKPATGVWSLTDGKPRRLPLATPLGLHVLVTAKAAELGLNRTPVPEARRKTAQADLDRWAAANGIIGRKVVWTVSVLSADDAFAAQEVDLLTDQLMQDRVDLLSHQTDLDSILANRADPRITRKLGREKTVMELQKRIAELNRRIPEMTLRIWDARVHTVKVRATALGKDDVVIVGDFHKDDKPGLVALTRDDVVKITGTVRRIRCSFTKAGAAEYAVELDRCRLNPE